MMLFRSGFWEVSRKIKFGVQGSIHALGVLFCSPCYAFSSMAFLLDVDGCSSYLVCPFPSRSLG